MRTGGKQRYIASLVLAGSLLALSWLVVNSSVVLAAVSGDSDMEAGGSLKNRRDPFRPPNLVPVNQQRRVPLTPLEKYEVGQLKLVGVVWQLGQPRAMVENEAGLGFIVSVGTRIGRNGGVVKKIEPGKVTIEEVAINFYGERETRKVEMQIIEEEEQ